MNMPALMTPKNAVNTSNMAIIPIVQRLQLTARGLAQSKKFRRSSAFQGEVMISGNRRRYGRGTGRLLGNGTRPVIGRLLSSAAACASGNRLKIILEARVNAAAACSSGLRC